MNAFFRTRIVWWSIILLFALALNLGLLSLRRVLLLHAFNYSFPATSVIAEAARKRLVEHSKSVEIDAEFLDLARNTDEAHALRTGDLYSRQVRASDPPDLVITLGSNALPFVVKYRDLLPDVPVVFASISPQTYAALRLPPKMTGIITAFDLAKTLSLAERLQPEARRLFVVAGSGETDRRWQPIARKMIEEHGGKFETTFLFELPYSELVAELSKIPSDAIVIVLTVFADSEGKTFVPAQVAADLSALSPAPVYGPYDTFIGKGPSAALLRRSNRSALRRQRWRSKSWRAGIRLRSRPEPTPRSTTASITARCNAGVSAKRTCLPTLMFCSKARRSGISIAALFLPRSSIVGLQTILLAALLIQRRRGRRVEDLLKDSEERMTFAAAAANIGLWQVDRDTGELWVTEHCRALFGLAERCSPDPRGPPVSCSPG